MEEDSNPLVANRVVLITQPRHLLLRTFKTICPILNLPLVCALTHMCVYTYY